MDYTGRCNRKYIQGGNRPEDTYDEGVQDLDSYEYIQHKYEFSSYSYDNIYCGKSMRFRFKPETELEADDLK